MRNWDGKLSPEPPRTEPIKIGITGVSRVGKDTIADYLVKEYGAHKIAFADALREALLVLDPEIRYLKSAIDKHYWVERLSSVVDRIGWDEAKKLDEVRRLQQVFGTDVCRMLFDLDHWVKQWSERVALRCKYLDKPPLIVAPDVRFQNEGDECDWVLKVTREGYGAALGHCSDKQDVGFAWCIANDGSVDDLLKGVDVYMAAIGLEKVG